MPGLTAAAERRGPVVAIIGGGASGTLAAIHLLRATTARRCPVSIVLIDRLGRHGLGQAYSTTHPAHYLNALTSRMSAVAGEPGHLLRWAASGGGTAGPFLPRRDFGRYLLDTLTEAERAALPPSRLTRVTSDVLAVRRGGQGRALRLVLAGGCFDADIAVLATGNLPPLLPFPSPAGPQVIADPWAPGALDPVPDGRPVVIAGTGQTMLDVAIAVTSASPGTKIHAVSRHGLLPRVHRGLPPLSSGGPRSPVWLPVLDRPAGQVRLTELIWQVRSAMAARPDTWQDVVDAVRPCVPGLWRRMPIGDKRMFLRHVARYWEVHRHRMPPATARRITELSCTRQLTVHAARVTAVTEQSGQLSIRLGDAAGISAGWLINATGPAADITRAASPLLADLFASGMARPDPLLLGIDAAPDGAVLDASGAASQVLFTLGPPLRGLWYESTAIPEIREQAAALAEQLAARRLTGQARRHPGSAA